MQLAAQRIIYAACEVMTIDTARKEIRCCTHRLREEITHGIITEVVRGLHTHTRDRQMRQKKNLRTPHTCPNFNSCLSAFWTSIPATMPMVVGREATKRQTVEGAAQFDGHAHIRTILQFYQAVLRIEMTCGARGIRFRL